MSSLPKDLGETYSRTIHIFESNDQLPDAIKALRWLCFSNRPLRLSELVDVLAIENGEDGCFCPDERLPDPEDIVVICSSLISCNSSRGGVADEDDEGDDNEDEDGGVAATKLGYNVGVRLAQFSVKEYLLSERCSIRTHFDISTCHQAIAEGCLHYLHYINDQAQPTRVMVGEYLLASHVAGHWWQHARSIDNTSDKVTTLFACHLLMNQMKCLTWVRHYNVDNPHKIVIDLSLNLPEFATPLMPSDLSLS